MSSSRGLIKSMLIIGSAQGVNIVISILRVKVVALLLGPAGIGLLGIYNNLREVTLTLGGLGLTTSGVREIADTKNDDASVSKVRRVLILGLALQGLLVMAGTWLWRDRLAVALMGDTSHATEIGLVGVAVFITLVAGSQLALLQGMRQIGDLARVTVTGALAGTLAGLLAIWLLGQDGLIWFLLVQPLATGLIALYYARKLRFSQGPQPGLREIWDTWLPMARLGVVFMAGGLITTGTLLLVRSGITQTLGLNAAGQFAAAWSITMTYVGFLLQAMGTDYFPRLTEVIRDRDAAAELINDQVQIALALGGPVLLLLIGGGPWLIWLLYSAEFAPAATLLQWQIAGNVFKLASWPLGFAFVAGARSGIFLFNQILWNGLFLSLGWAGMTVLGLDSFGVAFLAAYAIGFAVNCLLVRRAFGFRWQRLSLQLVAGYTLLSLGVLALALISPLAGSIAGIVLALVTGLTGGRIALRKIGSGGRFVSRAVRFYSIIGWPIRGLT